LGGYGEMRVPNMPLLSVAARFGLAVKAPPFNGRYLGWYSKEEISLSSPEESIFWHELGHAARERIDPTFGQRDKAFTEAVAEIVACVIGHLFRLGVRSANQAYHCIKAFSKDPALAAARLLKTVERSMAEILQDSAISEAA